jgi:hypothetical protein
MTITITPEIEARTLARWLRDHPGGTPEDYQMARRPFAGDSSKRHRRAHSLFLNWLNEPAVQHAIFARAS